MDPATILWVARPTTRYIYIYMHCVSCLHLQVAPTRTIQYVTPGGLASRKTAPAQCPMHEVNEQPDLDLLIQVRSRRTQHQVVTLGCLVGGLYSAAEPKQCTCCAALPGVAWQQAVLPTLLVQAHTGVKRSPPPQRLAWTWRAGNHSRCPTSVST